MIRSSGVKRTLFYLLLSTLLLFSVPIMAIQLLGETGSKNGHTQVQKIEEMRNAAVDEIVGKIVTTLCSERI